MTADVYVMVLLGAAAGLFVLLICLSGSRRESQKRRKRIGEVALRCDSDFIRTMDERDWEVSVQGRGRVDADGRIVEFEPLGASVVPRRNGLGDRPRTPKPGAPGGQKP